MKKNLWFIGLWLAVCVVGLSGCIVDSDPYEYVILEETTCSFLSEGNADKIVRVKASGAFDVSVSASWIRIIDRDGGGITVNVDDNAAQEERTGEITFTCGGASETVYVNQLGDMSGDWRFRWPSDFDLGAVMSPNGRYVGGILPVLEVDDWGEEWIYNIIIIDVEADERIVVAEMPESFGVGGPDAITDQGVFFFWSNEGSLAIDLEGNTFRPDVIDGYKMAGNVSAVSEDGNMWAGWIQDDKLGEGMYHPVIWENGIPRELEMPPLNYRDEPHWAGIMVRGMSADGSVLYGSTWDNNDRGMVYWKDGKVDYVGRDVRKTETVELVDGLGQPYEYTLVCGMTVSNEKYNISPNGKYIAGTYREEFLEGSRPGQREYAGFFNTETGKTTVIRDLGEGGGITATDEGIGFMCIGTFLPSDCAVVDIDEGVVLGHLDEWVRENYGVTLPAGYIADVAPNGTLFGRTMLLDLATGAKTTDWYLAPAK